jgi:hypothetical protein
MVLVSFSFMDGHFAFFLNHNPYFTNVLFAFFARFITLIPAHAPSFFPAYTLFSDGVGNYQVILARIM